MYLKTVNIFTTTDVRKKRHSLNTSVQVLALGLSLELPETG